MPDLFTILFNRWKLILGLTIAAGLLTLAISLIRPKQYGATATALPANSSLTDKARLFNNNIESLYPELGSVDEFDRIEGIAKLDTTYINVVSAFNLINHYGVNDGSPDSLQTAVNKLKKATEIRRSEYGDLKIKVWDQDPALAAQLANRLLEEINGLYMQTQVQNNLLTVAKLKLLLAEKHAQLESARQAPRNNKDETVLRDSVIDESTNRAQSQLLNGLPEQIVQLEQIISQYELGIAAAPQPLIVVENARATMTTVKPNLLQTTLFALAAGLFFSILLAFLLETRKRNI